MIITYGHPEFRLSVFSKYEDNLQGLFLSPNQYIQKNNWGINCPNNNFISLFESFRFVTTILGRVFI